MEIKSFFESVKKWEDIEALISNEIRETDTLEYKVATDPFSESNKKEIAKDVSAFANSSGGVLVYGVECDPRDKTKPIKISGVAEPNIETFDRVVNSQIRPEIKGLGKEIISKGNLKVMIILVPKSEASPHQSLADNKYYRRSLTESRPMEHDLVELHFGRRLGPILDVVMVNTNEKDFSNLTFKEDGFSEPVRLRFMITNSGKRVGKYVEVIFLFPHDSSVRLTGSEGLTNIDTLYSGRQARQFTENIGVFHPKMRKSVAEVTVEVSKAWLESGSEKKSLVGWVIYADEMDPRTGEVGLQEIKK